MTNVCQDGDVPEDPLARTELTFLLGMGFQLVLREFVTRPVPIHSALDLLAIDGLITSAFARATDAAQLEQLADRARRELFALGEDSA